MFKAKLTFSDKSTLVVEDGQTLYPIYKTEHNGEEFTTQTNFEIYYHHNAGLIPSLTELLSRFDFFQLSQNADIVYKSSAVVTIEHI